MPDKAFNNPIVLWRNIWLGKRHDSPLTFAILSFGIVVYQVEDQNTLIKPQSMIEERRKA
ncbi:hypothetical protein Vi05172_g3105 [Venturia inaequalis]|nr:hypothetical protein Vi05172_g3105 [Venturia inaequalis]